MIKKISVFVPIFFLTVSWIFSDSLQIPLINFPPKVSEVYALITLQNDATGTIAEGDPHTATVNVTAAADMIVVVIGIDDTSEGSFVGISDEDTATWVLGGSHTNGNQELRMYYTLDPAVNAANTITIDYSAATDSFVDAYTLAGTAASSPIDHSSVNNGDSSGPSVTFSSNGSDSLILFLGLQSTNGALVSWGADQQDRGTDVQGGAEKVAAFSSSEIVTASGSNNQSISLSKSDVWLTLGIEIKAEPPPPSIRLELGTHRWFQNLDATEPGLSATLNTPIIAPTQGTGFRLRLNLHVLDANLGIGGTTTKLQFGEKIGSMCEPTGDETYADVTTGSAIAYYENAGVSDNAPINAHNFDPRHSSTTSGIDTINLQNYNDGTSDTSFSNTQSAINQDEDGLWDFSLVDNSAPAGTSYCFRVVQNTGGGVIDDYGTSTLPEIRTRRPIRVQLIGKIILRKVRLTSI